MHRDFTKHMGSLIENEETKKEYNKIKEDRFGVQNAQRHKRTSRVWKIKSENWVNPVFTFPTINKGNCIVARWVFSSSHQILNEKKISPFSSMNIWTMCVHRCAAGSSTLSGERCVCVCVWAGASMCKHILLLLYSRRLIDVWIAVRSTFHGTDWLHRQEIASIHANHFLFKQNFVQHVHTF